MMARANYLYRIVQPAGYVRERRCGWANVVAALALAWGAAAWRAADAADRVVRKGTDAPRVLTGKIVAEAEDGGLLLLAPDGVMWPLQPNEYVERTKNDEPFRPLGMDAAGERLLAELPAGFKLHKTAHYVVCYNTSTAYAQWCGALYERLFRAFQTYWDTRGMKLNEPELPLLALVFDSRESYLRHVRGELGESAESIIGFYSPTTNRVSMYDLTGVEGVKLPGDRAPTSAVINQILQQPAAAPMVATIVHEATHQLAYNCGLQTRFADNPVWVSEGLAVYFETPDLRNSKGWGSIGNINRGRLIQFRKYLARRPANSLATLLSEDNRFREAETALDAYAEAWALNYFLLRTRSKEYVAYLKSLAAKPPAVYDDAETRLTEFRNAFGEELEKLDAEFLRYMRKLD